MACAPSRSTPPPAGQRVVDEADGVADVRGQARCVLVQVPPRDLVRRQRQPVVDLGQDEVLLFEDNVQFLAEYLGVQ